MTNNQEAQRAADTVYAALLERVGEANPRPRIEPVRRLSELCGSPQLSYPVIHIAGTNGKTSTARAIETILRSHGLRTGLMTSPHLMHFTERIQVDGEPISDEALLESWQELQLALSIVDAELVESGQGPITFFEALAVLGFMTFADAPVEVAIVEVGMGGEWDATNIVESKVSVITPIDLDHTSMLGSDLATIAATKAGIIKANSRVVSAVQAPEVAQAIRERAQAVNATLHEEGEHFALMSDRGGVGGRLIEARGLRGSTYEPLYIPLFGEHQSSNVLLAIAAVEAFFAGERDVPHQVLEEGLAALTSPGRLQLLGTEPSVYIDAAHNPHGAKVLADAIRSSFDFEELVLVVGVLSDKESEGILAELLPLADQVFVTAVDSDRTQDPERLAAIATDQAPELPITPFDTLSDALGEARAWANERQARGVLVAGSVVLVGEAMQIAQDEGWAVE